MNSCALSKVYFQKKLKQIQEVKLKTKEISYRTKREPPHDLRQIHECMRCYIRSEYSVAVKICFLTDSQKYTNFTLLFLCIKKLMELMLLVD